MFLGVRLKPWDGLLVVSALQFLSPGNTAVLSTDTSVGWLLLEQLTCARDRRAIVWPWASLILMSWTPIRDNALGLPLSIFDMIVLVAAVVTASSLPRIRLLQMQFMLMLVMPFAFYFSSFPASPDAGVSPRAFLVGFLLCAHSNSLCKNYAS
jgi:hypothetical protein